MRPRALLLLSLFGVACGGVELRGARAVPAGDEPGGRVLGAWSPRACRDAKVGPTERPSRLVLVQSDSGGVVLVDVRDGYDSVVIENSFVDGGERVFQLVARTEDDRLFLHDFRLPVAGAGAGRMAASDHFGEVERDNDRFRAYPLNVVMTCELLPETAAEPAGQPAPSAG